MVDTPLLSDILVTTTMMSKKMPTVSHAHERARAVDSTSNGRWPSFVIRDPTWAPRDGPQRLIWGHIETNSVQNVRDFSASGTKVLTTSWHYSYIP